MADFADFGRFSGVWGSGWGVLGHGWRLSEKDVVWFVEHVKNTVFSAFCGFFQFMFIFCLDFDPFLEALSKLGFKYLLNKRWFHFSESSQSLGLKWLDFGAKNMRFFEFFQGV